MIFYKDDFDIKLPMKVDMLLNKESIPTDANNFCKYLFSLTKNSNRHYHIEPERIW